MFISTGYKNNNMLGDKPYVKIMLIEIGALVIATAIMQANGFTRLEHLTQVMVLGIGLCLMLALFLCLKAREYLADNNVVACYMIGLGTYLRCAYVLLSGLYERQHDAGAYTGMGTEFINPGHIGYIEFIYKFGKLPDINPYTLFAYYHPPLHHIISFIWLKINVILGVCEELAFENLQIMPLLFSCLCMVVVYKTLKVLEIEGTGLLIGLSFMIFHPSTLIMAGSVNNDMLTILFMCLTMYFMFKWNRDKSMKNMVFIALVIGFGMITKLNSAVLAIPIAIIFLIDFIGVIKTARETHVFTDVILWIKRYVIFGLIVCPIGLCWVIRNLVRFKKKPGVPVPGETSHMYTEVYSLWERLGIPSIKSMHFDFPFHPESAKACANTWAIMMHTSLFAEEYPADMPDAMLVLCRCVFVLGVIMAIVLAVLLVVVMLNKETSLYDRIFVLGGYVIILISFAAFVIVYPYTCSSDFRYITICLVHMAIALGLGNKLYSAKIMKIINDGMVILLVTINIVYLLWNRW